MPLVALGAVRQVSVETQHLLPLARAVLLGVGPGWRPEAIQAGLVEPMLASGTVPSMVVALGAVLIRRWHQPGASACTAAVVVVVVVESRQLTPTSLALRVETPVPM